MLGIGVLVGVWFWLLGAWWCVSWGDLERAVGNVVGRSDWKGGFGFVTGLRTKQSLAIIQFSIPKLLCTRKLTIIGKHFLKPFDVLGLQRLKVIESSKKALTQTTSN